MQGTATIKAIRALGVKAIIVGSSGNDLAAEHLAAGADMCMRKPIPRPAAMAQRLRSILPLPSTWRVLFADDNPTVVCIMKRKLQIALPGVEVTVVSSGKAAIAAVMTEPYDLLILDQCMGDGVMGVDVARLARTKESLSAAAVVVGFSGNSMESEFLAVGCDAAWSKAINVEEIKVSLLECLRATTGTTRDQVSTTTSEDSSANAPLASAAPAPVQHRPLGLQQLYEEHGAVEYRKIGAMFSVNASVQASELCAHVKSSSWGAAQHLAHTMKGTFLILGLDCAADAAKLDATLKRVVGSELGGGGGDADAEDDARMQCAVLVAGINAVVAAIHKA